MKLLQQSAQTKMGAWTIERTKTGDYLVIYVCKVDATATPRTLKSTMEYVAKLTNLAKKDLTPTESNACGGRRSSRYSSNSVPSVSYSNDHRASPTYGYATPTYSLRVQVARPVHQAIAPPLVFSQTVPQQPVQLQTQQPVSPQQSVPVAAFDQANAVQMSALQALDGFAPPLPTSVPSQLQPVQIPVHVGNWTATPGNGATVQLTLMALMADGSFSWVATNQTGSASTFSGIYSVGYGSLSLTRADDNQQLAGSMNITNAFSFTLAGSNAAAISFSRN